MRKRTRTKPSAAHHGAFQEALRLAGVTDDLSPSMRAVALETAHELYDEFADEIEEELAADRQRGWAAKAA